MYTFIFFKLFILSSMSAQSFAAGLPQKNPPYRSIQFCEMALQFLPVKKPENPLRERVLSALNALVESSPRSKKIEASVESLYYKVEQLSSFDLLPYREVLFNLLQKVVYFDAPTYLTPLTIYKSLGILERVVATSDVFTDSQNISLNEEYFIRAYSMLVRLMGHPACPRGQLNHRYVTDYFMDIRACETSARILSKLYRQKAAISDNDSRGKIEDGIYHLLSSTASRLRFIGETVEFKFSEFTKLSEYTHAMSEATFLIDNKLHEIR